jgi:hypothetical protein
MMPVSPVAEAATCSNRRWASRISDAAGLGGYAADLVVERA